MFFDILAVLVVSLVSPLFLCTTSVHGLPSSPTSVHYIHNSPSADLSSSLRLLKHRPVPSGDISEMFIGENTKNDDSSLSAIDLSNEPLKYYLKPSSSSSSSSLLSNMFHQEKRSSPTQFNINSAVAALADSSNGNSVVNLNQLKEPIRLSPSLKTLVETNPFARAWLTLLLQKLMQDQHVPYIFKYGRRRK
jgi:hypothetical protein